MNDEAPFTPAAPVEPRCTTKQAKDGTWSVSCNECGPLDSGLTVEQAGNLRDAHEFHPDGQPPA